MASPVFISYSSRDRAKVARIAADLAALGVRVWWDKWELKVGDSLHSKIQDGIREAGWLCIALSENSVKSPWVQRELSAALYRELEEKRVFVLPLLIESCAMPIFLGDKVYADFTASYEEGFSALVDRVAPRLDPSVCASLSSSDDARVESAARNIEPGVVAPYVRWLAARLASEHDNERRAAVVALNTLRPTGLPGYLSLAANDASSSIRMLAALCLAQVNTPTSRHLLHSMTQDPVAYVRAAARDALARIGG